MNKSADTSIDLPGLHPRLLETKCGYAYCWRDRVLDRRDPDPEVPCFVGRSGCDGPPESCKWAKGAARRPKPNNDEGHLMTRNTFQNCDALARNRPKTRYPGIRIEVFEAPGACATVKSSFMSVALQIPPSAHTGDDTISTLLADLPLPCVETPSKAEVPRHFDPSLETFECSAATKSSASKSGRQSPSFIAVHASRTPYRRLKIWGSANVKLEFRGVTIIRHRLVVVAGVRVMATRVGIKRRRLRQQVQAVRRPILNMMLVACLVRMV